MPDKIEGQPGTSYEPGTRKGKTYVPRCRRADDGAEFEVATTGDSKQAGRHVGHTSEPTIYRYRILRAPELAPAVRFRAAGRE